MSQDNNSLEFRIMNWKYYLKHFNQKEILQSIENELRSKEIQHQSGYSFLIAIRAILQTQFADNSSLQTTQTSNHINFLKDCLKEGLYDPLICLFLAEYQQQLKQKIRLIKQIRADFLEVWYYQLLSSLIMPVYFQNFTYQMESLQKLKNIVDQDLSNSFELLGRNLPDNLKGIKDIVFSHLRFQLEGDVLVKLKYFKQLRGFLNEALFEKNDFMKLLAFEVLLGLGVQYRYDLSLIKMMKKAYQAQKLFITKKLIEVSIIYSKLTEDHEFYQNFRAQIKEYIYLRQFCQIGLKPTDRSDRVIENEINITSMKVLRCILEHSKDFLNQNELEEIGIQLSKLISYLSRGDESHMKMLKTQRNLDIYKKIKEKDLTGESCIEFRLRKVHLNLKLFITTLQEKQELLELHNLIEKNPLHQKNYINKQIQYQSQILRFLKSFYLVRIMKYQSQYYERLNRTVEIPQSVLNFNTQNSMTLGSFFNIPEIDKSCISPISQKTTQTSSSKFSQSFYNNVQIYSKQVLDTYLFYQREFEESGTYKYLALKVKTDKYVDIEDSLDEIGLNYYLSINSFKDQRDGTLKNLQIPSPAVQGKVLKLKEQFLERGRILNKGDGYSTYMGKYKFVDAYYSCVVKEYAEEDIVNLRKWEGVPGVVPVYGIIECKSSIIKILPIAQKTLNQFLNEVGKLSLVSIMCIFNELCRLLNKIHEKGLVHGNLKESNIFMDQNNIYLSDFHLSKSEVSDKQKDAQALVQIISNLTKNTLQDIKTQQLKELKILLDKTVKNPINLQEISKQIEIFI